jgi:hypothetical protein
MTSSRAKKKLQHMQGRSSSERRTTLIAVDVIPPNMAVETAAILPDRHQPGPDSFLTVRSITCL